jgi:hypothetical protein
MLPSPLIYTYLVEKSFGLYLVRFSLSATIDTASSPVIGVEKNVGKSNEPSNPRYTATVATVVTAMKIGIFLFTVLF